MTAQLTHLSVCLTPPVRAELALHGRVRVGLERLPLIASAGEAGRFGAALESILLDADRIRAGEPAATADFARYAGLLAQGLVNFIHIFDPELISLADVPANLGAPLLAALDRAVDAACFYPVRGAIILCDGGICYG